MTPINPTLLKIYFYFLRGKGKKGVWQQGKEQSDNKNYFPEVASICPDNILKYCAYQESKKVTLLEWASVCMYQCSQIFI